MQAATLQGSNITFKTDSVYFDKNSTGLNGSLEDPGSLSGVQEVTISTASGETIKTIEVTKGEDGKYNWKWDGTDSNGNKAKEGEYIIAAKSVETKEPARVLAGGEVIEIGFEPMTHAVVEGGCRFKIGDMIKINKSESK
nr:FlgD immunoglobulin-like domain containing protein [Photobacterium leiognathi]